LEPKVTSGEKFIPSVECSILKPSSFAALSIQARLIWLEETAVAVRLDGAAGGAGGVARTVRLTVVERVSEPLVPVTVKL
jgi:hypothetical protein